MIEVVELSSNTIILIVLRAFNVGPIADVSVSIPLCPGLRPGRETFEFYIHIECYSMSPYTGQSQSKITPMGCRQSTS